MTKENVLVIYHFFPHYRGSIIKELIKNSEYNYLFMGDDHDPFESGIKEFIIDQPGHYIYAPSIKLNRKYLIQKGIVKIAFRNDFHTFIYLGDANFISTWISALIARLSGKRVLFWTQGWLNQYEAGFKAKVRNLFYKLAHGLLLYGNRAKQIGIRNGFNSKNLYVIYNSLDYDLQKKYRSEITNEQLFDIRRKIFPNNDRPILICIGRLIKERKLEILFHALAVLKLEGCEVNLLLVGDGPEHLFLQKEIADLGISVILLGECYDEKILAGLIMASNLTVSPGRTGLTAIHSLAYGTPVIIHDNFDQHVPEAEAIVQGENGDLFRQDDAIDLANVIKKWISHYWPDENIQKKCYRIVEQFYNSKYQAMVINDAVAGRTAEYGKNQND